MLNRLLLVLIFIGLTSSPAAGAEYSNPGAANEHAGELLPVEPEDRHQANCPICGAPEEQCPHTQQDEELPPSQEPAAAM